MDLTPFNIIATLLFFLAIVHMFLTPSLVDLSRVYARKKERHPEKWKHYHFLSEVCFLLGEVEVVFGIWLIPLLLCFTLFNGWQNTLSYLNSRDYTQALYIAVVLVVVGSRPIITFAERLLEWIAKLGRESPGAWWWTILLVAPLLGSLLKEPVAMVIAALLLTKKFYPFKPSTPFQYATLGLLFANISVGGMLTTFASRALFVVTEKLGWDSHYMLYRFGWKVVLGMVLATGLYYFLFRHEFKRSFPPFLPPPPREEQKKRTPFWITLIHIVFLTLVVITSETPPLFIGVLILFLGFWKATQFYQSRLHLRSAVLIGFFFAGLTIHGELQTWWILPLMKSLSPMGILGVSYLLSAFMDNAIVGYLILEIPEFGDLQHYLVVSGVMAAGALTVVANAPNPIGHSILRPSFGSRISFFYLFLGALPPSLIFLALFWFFQ